MFTLRCTGKLHARLAANPRPDSAPPSTRLGDWYATLAYVGREQLVLCVSERSLLPVVIPAKDARTLVPRLRDGLEELLMLLGVPAAEVERECAEMAAAEIARTASRTVLGSMNDFLRMLPYQRPGASLLQVSRELARAPCGPLGMRTPEDVAGELLRRAEELLE